ncbi:hypothetical protein Q9Q94_16370 [Uliginosibacterium sp. 31-16]|uniref:hypothetical protein n=1 Tax=Uliginosibacterium sp. 31-16 TaxID=3068315 RepID=UPI00273EED84|nr:hypothetical protein [Uliginosibacterium sp. 31-16]MDP5241118.1 hypothetical protein [Uliginosibacterium sp. 31-16]
MYIAKHGLLKDRSLICRTDRFGKTDEQATHKSVFKYHGESMVSLGKNKGAERLVK